MGMQITKKVGIGKFVAPLWAVGLTGAALAAVAGTAVGPVLSGSVTGTVGATIEQAVVLGAAPSDSGVSVDINGSAVGVTGADDSVGVMNDEGTSFTYAFETQVGQSQGIDLVLHNDSGQSANAILELNVPAGVDVDVDEIVGEEASVAQLSANRWLMTIDPTTDGDADVNILVEPKDDLKPGFYTITGRIIQIAG